MQKLRHARFLCHRLLSAGRCCGPGRTGVDRNADDLGLNPILMGAGISTGGVMGKMIDAQSIVVASTATRQAGQKRRSSKPCSSTASQLACLVGLIVLAYADVFSALVP